MRVFILLFSVWQFSCSGANAAKAGPSTTVRDQLASVDPAIFADSNQQTEDQIGLNKAKRREVQRGLTRLGFDTKSNGKFDEPTRAVITRWQAARSYPETGFLNMVQYTALQAEIVLASRASVSDTDKPDDVTLSSRRAALALTAAAVVPAA